MKTFVMNKTILKTILRYFTISRHYTLLNIVGLTIGIVLFVLITFLLNYELSYDIIHKNRKEIFQVCEKDLKSGELKAYSALPLPITLRNDFPEVKHVCGIWHVLDESASIKYNEMEYTGFKGASVEPDFFKIFSVDLLIGDIKSVLSAPDKIAVSSSFAKKIFGTENPVGKTITIDRASFTISHVFCDLPENSSAQFDMLFSDKMRELYASEYKIAWWWGGMMTYVMLQDNYPVDEFNKHLKEIPARYYPDFLKGRSTYFSLPFYRSHFNTSLVGQSAVSYTYIILLGTIALIILIIACVNYINLTLARSFKMSIDAGIRRIIGASARQIVSFQVWLSFLISIIAFALAIPLVFFSLPLFEQLAERSLRSLTDNITVWLLSFGVSVIVGIISGLVPGFAFSKVVPASIIKSKNSLIKLNKKAHNGLMVFQFSLAIALIITQFFIIKQISFMRNADLGFNNNNLITIRLSNVDLNYGAKYEKAKVYKDELEKQGARYGLSKGSITENIPGFYYQNSFTVKPEGSFVDECLVVSTAVDENFINTFGLKLANGRFFSEKYSTDKTAFIINETAMKQIGWENIDGKILKLAQEDEKYPVIGVLKDIHPNTLKDPIPPMLFRYGQHNNFPAFITFRILPNNKSQTIDLMQKTWERIFPDTSFDYMEVKDTYYKNYTEEHRLSKIIGIFAFLAILLTLLGLWGLIIFYSEGRIKEIGVRRVNGAQVSEIMTMLNKDFVILVAVAFLLSAPLAGYSVNKWLQNFAYRTELSWWVFAVAGAIAVALAAFTVSWQSFRAATKNPVEALRYE